MIEHGEWSPGDKALWFLRIGSPPLPVVIAGKAADDLYVTVRVHGSGPDRLSAALMFMSFDPVWHMTKMYRDRKRVEHDREVRARLAAIEIPGE